MRIYLIYICILFNVVFSKNLTLHDYDNPSATHILDTEIIGDLLIVSGMIGGIEFYDISDRVIMLNNGTIQFDGTPKELDSSDDIIVKQFIKGDSTLV